MARDTREHFRPNFFSVVKRKDEVGSPFLDQNDAIRVAVRCAILFAARPQVPDARGRPAIPSCCGKDLRESWDRFTIFYPIRKDT